MLRYLGLGEETVFGTAVPADFHLDVSSCSIDVPSDTDMQYEGGIGGRTVRTRRTGYYAPGGNFSYAFDVETIRDILYWTLGGDHAGTLYGSNKRDLPSFTCRVGKDYFEHVFAGCCMNSLTLSVSDGFAECSGTVVARIDSNAVLKATEDLILVDKSPLVFHEVTAKIAGTDRSAKVKSVSINITNGINVGDSQALGSRYPYRYLANARNTTIDIDFVFGKINPQDDPLSELKRYWGGTNGPNINGGTPYELELVFNAGSEGSMTIKLPKTIYTSVNTQGSGRNAITQSLSATAYVDPSTTTPDKTEILVTFTGGGP